MRAPTHAPLVCLPRLPPNYEGLKGTVALEGRLFPCKIIMAEELDDLQDLFDEIAEDGEEEGDQEGRISLEDSNRNENQPGMDKHLRMIP